MSRNKAATEDKPKGRGGKREPGPGKSLGRPLKYGVPLVTRSLRMRVDVWEAIANEAATQGISQGEVVTRMMGK